MDKVQNTNTPLDDTGRRVSVSDAVRANITVHRGLEECCSWSDSQFCNKAKTENIKHFEWRALSEHSVPVLSDLLVATRN